MDRVNSVSAARGKWREILPALGVDLKFLKNQHGPCPHCGGADRFRFDDKDGKGTYFCNGCGSGDGFKLLGLVNGWTFAETAKEVDKMTGRKPDLNAPSTVKDDEGRRQSLKRLWDGATPPTAHGPVSKYLERRLGFLVASNSIRQSLGFLEPETGLRMPAMICKISGPDNRAHNLHVTYLTSDGEKAEISKQKRVMRGEIPAGSAIRLSPQEEHMGIAEGIETAIAASKLFGISVWSSMNATMMSKWIPPEGVTRVTVFGDNDASFAGQLAAHALANRLVVQRQIKTDILIPPIVGQDWADVLGQVSTDQDH